METWLLLGIFGYSFHAVSICIDKYMMNKKYDIISTNTIRIFFNGMILTFLGLIFFNLNFTVGLFIWCLIIGLFFTISIIVYYYVLRLKELGEIMPFYQSSRVLFIFIFSAIVFNEIVTFLDYIGVALILIGIYLVLSENWFKIPKIDKSSVIVLLSLPTSIINAILVKNLLFDVEPINLAISIYFSAALILTSFQLFSKRYSLMMIRKFKSKIPTIMSASFFASIGTLFVYMALSVGNASKVYPIAGVQSVFIFIIAIAFLKEKFYFHRFVGVVIIFFGIFLIS